MLVTRKISLFTFLSGKQNGSGMVKAAGQEEVQVRTDYNPDQMNGTIGISKVDEIYKLYNTQMMAKVINPFRQMNR